MVRFLYNILIPILIPGALIRLWFRGRAELAYRHHLAERFGHVPSNLGSGADIWSIGRINANPDLIHEFQAELGLQS